MGSLKLEQEFTKILSLTEIIGTVRGSLFCDMGFQSKHCIIWDSDNFLFTSTGNHECRLIQQNFSFYQECLDKFGQELGETVWEEINLVFDSMSIAAVIDSKIFCVHGGIPPPSFGDGKISAIDKVSRNIADPEVSTFNLLITKR